MKTYNKATLIGFLGQDPKFIETEKSKLTTFSLATTERDAEGKDVPEWHDVVTFGKSADYVKDHFKKGAFALVEGRIRSRKWTDQDGNNRLSKTIIANRVLHMERKAAESHAESEASDGENLDDVPF